jgi:Ni/Co efflux regulator RcnB
MSADAAIFHRVLRVAALAIVAASWAASAFAGDAEDRARVRRAIAYLDDRQDQWSKFSKAERGEGAEKTTCVSCHTGVGYVLARPALRAYAETAGPAPAEGRLVAASTLRVEHWTELDTSRFALMYDFDERKKVESRGTEAVLNALVLARDEASRGRKELGPATQSAFRHLWATQATEGNDAGSWAWLNFGLGPWEANGSRAFGAALAAIAVGSAPGSLDRGTDEAGSKGVRLLRDYLGKRFPKENPYNRLWILEASTTFEGLLSDDQKREVVDQLLALRREDGGWSLATLGDFKRGDGKPQNRDSDGHATGLVVHALLRTGSPSGRPEVAGGLAWLRSHQQADGSWPGRSLNKERDPATFIGKLMVDAATAMAALAIAEAAHLGN